MEKIIAIGLILHVLLCEIIRRVFLDNIVKLKHDVEVLENEVIRLEKKLSKGDANCTGLKKK